MNKPVYRMSGSGYCPRKLGAIRLEMEGEPFPKWLETSANEGNWHEKRIKDELVEQGYQVFGEQEELKIECDNFTLVGHIDGKVYTPDKVMQLLEIKSMSQYEFDRWMKNDRFAAFPQYACQIACYFRGTELDECLYIVKNRNNGYMDTSLISVKDFPVEPIIKKIAEVEYLATDNKLVDVEFDSNSLECKRCQFKLLCIPEITKMDIATREQLDMAVAEVRDGNKLLAEGTELYNRGKNKLYKHTVASDLKKWQHNELAVLLINVKEQTTYPKENLLEKYSAEELADIAKVKNGYSYLRLDDLEKDDAQKG